MEKKNQFLFEVSWEVCNKVGGIYTVITSKLKQVEENFGSNYFLIGPLMGDNVGFIEEKGAKAANIKHKLESIGIEAKVGKCSELATNPSVILIKVNNETEKDKLLFDLWDHFGVESMHGGWDYVEPVLFGTLAGRVIGALSEIFDKYQIIAHFHEWMAGAGVMHLKKSEPHIATVFTTHATVLGRSMAGNGVDIYNQLQKLNPDSEAYNFNVPAKYSMEKTSAQEADCFTTVSEITAIEAESLLNVKIDAVLPNGFNVLGIPDRTEKIEYFNDSRKKLLDFGSRFCQKTFDDNNTIILTTSGRYEYHNKGIDLFLDTIGQMKEEGIIEKDKNILIYLNVLAGSEEMSISDESRENITRFSNISTHPLWHPSSDPIANTCRKYDMINREGDQISIVFIPVYLNGKDGLLNMPYYEVLAGCDLSVYASYYEPWGYTPMESIVCSVPTVTTDLAGFGQWVISEKGKTEGIKVLTRLNKSYEDNIEELKQYLLKFFSLKRSEINKLKDEVRKVALKTDWSQFYKHYIGAYKIAEQKCLGRLKGIEQSGPKTEKIEVRGTDSQRPRLRSLTIKSLLPEKLNELRELAYNIWWCWTPDAHQLFNRLDPVLYDKIGNNPVSLIESLDPERFTEVMESKNYMSLYENVITRFKSYMQEKDSLIDMQDVITPENPIAYFSMEFGFHESLPIYSGGLGILSGDHIKSASDLNLNLIGIGLLYKQGYFKQGISIDGNQKADYFNNDFYRMPLEEVKKNNKPVLLTIDFPGRKVYAKAWKANVGRISVYFLDTNILQNNSNDRDITSRLYGGGKKVRIEQEIILGIGGVKLLQELNITPSVFHLNEGHSAFLIIQRIINQMKYNKLDFKTAKEVIKASTVFTTHTPVPAGNEVFDMVLVESYLKFYVDDQGLGWDKLNELARRNVNDSGKYEMTVLALSNTLKRNGVSKLHGMVSRKMWSHLWSGFLQEEVPITYITNGVHVGTWLSTGIKELFSKYFSLDFHEELLNRDFWSRIENIPDKELWETHVNQKNRFFNYIKEKVTLNWTREGVDPAMLDRFLGRLSSGPLTIGFARRFATYKRATLLFKDFERFKRIVSNTKYPVQFVFAGKAHPDDIAGQNLIREIVSISKQEDFLGKVIFLEDYDIGLARKLVSSVDVWLNNPIRPNEASGTSGMKAGMNGVLNCSILDGWWDEGYNHKNGWSFGELYEYKNNESQNIFDSESFYDILENEIIPIFYSRNNTGIPEKWLAMMKNSMASIIAEFNTHRMLDEYMTKLYLPAAKQYKNIIADNFAKANVISEWKNSIRTRFSSVHIKNISISGSKGDVLNVNDNIQISLEIDKGKLNAPEIKAQLLILPNREHDTIVFEEDTRYFDEQIQYVEMDFVNEVDGLLYFQCEYKATSSGKFNYGIRVLPDHPEVDDEFDLNLVYWA